jgi:type II secretory pathway pseudopilin PulG
MSMKSAKCAQCGFVGWPDAEFCKKCGAPVSASPAYEADQPSGNVTTYYANQNVAFEEDLKNGWAIASLTLGIANFLLLSIFLIPSIVGVVISVVALNKIKRFPHVYGGKGLAIGGLVTNIVSVAAMIPVLIIAAIAIPNLLASRRAANEGATIRALRIIHAAEQTYQSTEGNGDYGSLADLRRTSLISEDMAREIRSGYRYRLEVVKQTRESPAAFTLGAVPTEYGSTGKRSFFIDETGVLRGEDRTGVDASRETPPLGSDRGLVEERSGTRRSSRYADDD